MDQFYNFPRDSILPSFFANRIQDFVASTGRFRLQQATANSIEVPAGPEDEAVAIAIERRYRFVEADVTRAHPGGAAGTYDVWVTAAENDIDNTPDPFTDNTEYAFDLAITATGVEPGSVPGVVDIWRQVGELEWDGAAITSVTPLVGPQPGLHAASHAAGGEDELTPGDIGAQPLHANLTEFATLALIADRLIYGDGAGSLALTPFTAAARTLLDDEDAAAMRTTLGLDSDDAVTFGDLTLVGDLSLGDDMALAAGSVLTWAGDTNLYRLAANVLKTDDAFMATRFRAAAQDGLVFEGDVDTAKWLASIGYSRTTWFSDNANTRVIQGSAASITGPDGRTYRPKVAFTPEGDVRVARHVIVDSDDGELRLGLTGDTALVRAGAGILQTPGKFLVTGEVELDAALNHDGTTIGFYGVAPVARSAAYTSTGTTDRALTAASDTLPNVANVLHTLIQDLKLTGIIG